MQHQSELSLWELVRHVFVYSTVFGLVSLEAVYGSVVDSLVSHVVTSTFVLHVLAMLEYAIVACNAITVTLALGQDVLRNLKR